MTMNAAIQNLLKAKPADELLVCSQQDYFNESNPQYSEVCEVILENSKVIILTR